jgi:recombination protein RecA
MPAKNSNSAQPEIPQQPAPKADEARRAVLNKALDDITKRYGEGSIVRLGEARHMEVAAIPTGSISLDIALGVGGIPRARVTEIFGPESSGKTTLCLHVAAEAQKMGGTVAFVDMEHALDPAYAAKVGVDIENLLISQPDTGEQALEIVQTLVRSGALDLVVVDSVAALVPQSEIEGDMGDATMGMQARLMSQALRKLSGAINQTRTAVIFTNQLRQKIGVYFGNPEPPQAVWRSNSMPPSAWTCAVSNPSSPVPRSSAIVRACVWSRTSRPALPYRRIRHHVQRRYLPRRRHY